MVGEIEQGIPAAPVAAMSVTVEQPALPEGEQALVKKWLARITRTEKHHKPAFDRMKKCQQIAAHGAYKEWLEEESRYVVPVVNRHVNLAVSQLYAKNPQSLTTVRARMLHTVWDGTQEQLLDAQTRTMLGDPAAAMLLMAIEKDIAQAQVSENMTERAADTLQRLYEYQVSQQPYPFKTQIKALVRRAKVNGVGYVKLNFLREKEMRPETAARLEDAAAKLRLIERLAGKVQNPDDTHEAERTQLESLMKDLEANPDRVAREQIVFDYPRSTEILLDPKTKHLKSLMGCSWLAHSFDFTADEIQDLWKIDIRQYQAAEEKKAREMLAEDGEDCTYRCYEVQDKQSQQVFVICRGYSGFLKQPAEPEVWFESFFNVIPLVFNEIEHDEELYPPSDVWAARHMQFEYNRSREGLREHRIAAKPYWLSMKGQLDETDKERLRNHAAHEIVEVNPGAVGDGLEKLLTRGPTPPVDPALYDVEGLQVDLLRSVGSQEANIGGTSGGTATESTIAENSRMSSLSDNVDDLDEMLTLLAKVSGQVLLQQMTTERVQEIVGPGAVWPEFIASRRALADEIMLETKAGSSGRPNQAAQLANIERAWPALSQLPNINPEPLAETYAGLLDIDFKRLSKQGALSIVAQNAMMSKPAAPPSNDPSAQGSEGSENAEKPPEDVPPGQPAFPSGGEGLPVM